MDASKLEDGWLPGGSAAGGLTTFGFGRIDGGVIREPVESGRRPGRATAPAGGFTGLDEDEMLPDMEDAAAAAPGCAKGGGAGAGPGD